MSCDHVSCDCVFSITSSKSDRGSLEPVPEQGSVLEQDSVSEQVQSDAKTEDIQDGVCSEGESDDILEMSFFEDLKVGVAVN